MSASNDCHRSGFDAAAQKKDACQDLYNSTVTEQLTNVLICNPVPAKSEGSDTADSRSDGHMEPTGDCLYLSQCRRQSADSNDFGNFSWRKSGRAGAAFDCVWQEPLPADSGLWGLPNVLITPHTAGETRRYEDNVIDLLLENLERLWRGDEALKNQFV